VAHVEDRWQRADRKGNGKRWRVRYIGPDGRERSKSFDRKPDADRFMVTTAADVARGIWTDPDAGKITLRQFAGEWLAVQTFSPSTREVTEIRLRKHILPVLGDYTLAQLASRPSLVQGWVSGLDVAPRYAEVIFTLLSTLFNAAMADELVSKNPCQARNVERPRPGSRKIRPWTAERVEAVRQALPARYRVLCDLGKGLGLRQGECFGLAVEDVDRKHRVVHVVRQVRIVGGKMCFAPPKTDRERDIPLPGSVWAAVEAHLREHPARPVTLPWLEPGGRPVTASLIMTSPEGMAVNRPNFNRRWNVALRAAGVPGGRDAGTHQLRHHFASTLLHAGVDVRALAEYLGHADPGFTLRVYCHLMPTAHDRMRAAVDADFTAWETEFTAADGPVTAREAGTG
jgi:integrase